MTCAEVESISSKKQQYVPYVGPRPFKNNSQDRAVFFGRDYESQEIISLILANPIVLVYSPSGSGKSSIFNAKIYPMLEEQYGFQVFPTALVRGAIPEDLEIDKIPNLFIFNTLQSLIPNSNSKVNSTSIQKEDLSSFIKKQQYSRLSSKIDDIEEKEGEMGDDDGEPHLRLIVFDQFEDFFNIFPLNDWQKQQNDFFIQVIKALEDDPSLRIVFVMREEYVAQLDHFANNLPGRLRARYRLEPLRREAALLTITQPLKNTSVYFAPGVAEELVDNLTKIHVEDVFHHSIITKGEYVEPVHLQVVCQRLWNKVVSQRLTQITHDQLDDVDAALKEFYEEAVHDTSKQTKIKEEIIRNWCENKLITTTGTRSIIHQESNTTGGLSNNAVSLLEKKYLVRAESRFGATWFELTHDRLIEPIKESNKIWHKQQAKSKRSSHLKVIVPITVIAIVLISIFVYNIYEQSILQQQKLLSQQKKLVNALVDASISLVNKGNYTGAISNLNKVLSIDSKNVNALIGKSLALDHLGNHTGSIQYLKKALSVNSKDVNTLNIKGVALKRFGNYTGAISYYDKALAINSKYVDALNNKGLALDHLGNHTGAISYYDKALAINSKYVMALYDKGLALDHLGNHTGAISYYDKALAINSKYVDALNNKGISLDNLGNHTGAISYYDKVLAIDPKDVDALNNKGFALSELGKYNEGIVFIDKALSINPKNTDALDSKGFALDGLGRHNEAIGLFDKALSINPKNTDALVHKGFALSELGKYNEGIVFIDKALSINPKNTDALDSKGFALDGLGRHNEAIGLFDKALSINPKNTDVLNAKKHSLIAFNDQTTTLSQTSSYNQTTTAPTAQ